MTDSSGILNAGILIVDDQEANVLLLERMLRDAGYISVASTTDPAGVCELHLRNRYDLILLDLIMPGMDGFGVIEGLKEIETEGYLPVLVITSQPDHKLRALQTGAKDFISKPFELAEVLARVHNMLEVRLLHKASLDHGKMLESMAMNDPLTGLANRRLLTVRMSMSLAHARRMKRSFAVVYLDLDEFKGINDRLGHGVGDILLKMVAARLKAICRKEDTLARPGGDEFIILLSEIKGPDCAAIVASKAIEALSKPYDIEGNTLCVTASAGIAIYPSNGGDADTLIENADLALYDAKRAGKNAYRLSSRGGCAGSAPGMEGPMAPDMQLPGSG